MNKLSQEQSPYLLQHKDNPVDWYPWGEEAIAAAKKQQKPIFLSIGYSTCHWCHVMAHESFENKKVAELLNRHFINIKVDREERPDVDALYMSAVQHLTGMGGWPLSVWLTPDLKPFYGGTYFPLEDRMGRPSFTSIVEQLARLWAENRPDILHCAENILHAITRAHQIDEPHAKTEKNELSVFEVAFHQLKRTYDSVHGGFGQAPKFPMPVNLQFLIHYYERTGNTDALAMVTKTFEQMTSGGLYDQLGGGFARYSTDNEWLVPHFEKMLYDNAQLINSGANLFRHTKNETLAKTIRDTAQYILRELTHPDGGFFSAEDADSEGKEGVYYLWTLNEINSILPEQDAALAQARFGVSAQGNFYDPHTEELGKNVLFKNMSISELAAKFQQSETTIEQRLHNISSLLFSVRQQRTHPMRDDKILTGWNGLTISAFVTAAMALNEPAYLNVARKAVDFIKGALYEPQSKTLFRMWCKGMRKIPAHQTDYAYFIQGLLDLFQATADPYHLQWAIELNERHQQLFLDEKGMSYYMTSPQPDVLVRLRDDTDNVIVSGNSVATWNNIRISEYTARSEPRAQAIKTAASFVPALWHHPGATLNMIMAVEFLTRSGADLTC